MWPSSSSHARSPHLLHVPQRIAALLAAALLGGAAAWAVSQLIAPSPPEPVPAIQVDPDAGREAPPPAGQDGDEDTRSERRTARRVRERRAQRSERAGGDSAGAARPDDGDDDEGEGDDEGGDD